VAIPTKRTLGDLRRELQARLGFASVGTRQTDILNSFLRDAQEQLYEQFNHPSLKTTTDLVFAPGEQFKVWPDNCDPARMLFVQVQTGNIWVPVDKGIDYRLDSINTVGGWVQRYDDGYDPADGKYKMEVWPIPTQSWTVRLEYTRRLDPFVSDTNPASVAPRDIFLFALANAKAHYRQPDAKQYGEQVRAFSRRMVAAEHVGERYIKGEREEVITPPPQMV